MRWPRAHYSPEASQPPEKEEKCDGAQRFKVSEWRPGKWAGCAGAEAKEESRLLGCLRLWLA